MTAKRPSAATHMTWPRLLSKQRHGATGPDAPGARTPFERDFDRILFSTPFRRLVGKTQVVVQPRHDHVHTRLLHSLETASVGRSLGTLVERSLRKLHPRAFARDDAGDLGAVVAAACLMHDLGNPPFGHAGEEAIGAWFSHAFAAGGALHAIGQKLSPAQRADLEHFEGNAQGFRIATRLTMYRDDGGMRLTAAVLASFAKYPHGSDALGQPGVKKHGYHQLDAADFAAVAKHTGLKPLGPGRWARHPAAWLVEAADDICYQILDLEDAYRLHQVDFSELQKLLVPLTGGKDSALADEGDKVGELRARAISHLIDQAHIACIAHQRDLLDGVPGEPLVLRTPLAKPFRELQHFSRQRLYLDHGKLRDEIGGQTVIAGLLDRLVPAVLSAKPDPTQQRILTVMHLSNLPDDPARRLMAVCDVVTGMTDRHAVLTLDGFRSPL